MKKDIEWQKKRTAQLSNIDIHWVSTGEDAVPVEAASTWEADFLANLFAIRWGLRLVSRTIPKSSSESVLFGFCRFVKKSIKLLEERRQAFAPPAVSLFNTIEPEDVSRTNFEDLLSCLIILFERSILLLLSPVADKLSNTLSANWSEMNLFCFSSDVWSFSGGGEGAVVVSPSNKAEDTLSCAATWEFGLFPIKIASPISFLADVFSERDEFTIRSLYESSDSKWTFWRQLLYSLEISDTN